VREAERKTLAAAVVIPEEAVPAFDELLRRYRVTRSMVPIWSQRP